jgi:hypothetical protein
LERKKKNSLFTDDKNCCAVNLKESTKISLRYNSDYRQLAGYKWTAFLNASNEQAKFEIKNIILFVIATKYLI